MDVVPGPSSPLLSKRIADALQAPIAKVTFKKFPDGEIYVRVESKDDSHLVVCSVNSNDDLVALILTLDALKGDCFVAVPYMGYARQDKVFLEGEAVSIKAIAKLIESYANKVYTVNIHSAEARSYFKKLEDLDAMPLIGKYYSDRDVVMISPDKGSVGRVKVAAEVAGCEWDYLEKRRIDATTVEISPKEIEIEGKKVVIVDDIVSTGGTVVEATKNLKKAGAREVEVACVHAVLADFAAVKLFCSGVTNLIATDTVENVFSKISVARLISDNLR